MEIVTIVSIRNRKLQQQYKSQQHKQLGKQQRLIYNKDKYK